MHSQEKLCDGQFYYALKENGEAVILGANEWPEVLRIPNEVAGHVVTEIGMGAFDTDAVIEQSGLVWNQSVPKELLAAKYMDLNIQRIAQERIKEVYLPDTIQRIGACAFYQNNALEKINFPRGLKEIDSCAFANTQLSKVCVPKECKIYHEEGCEIWQEQGAFEGCGGYDEGGYIPADPAYGIEIEYFED